MAVVIGLGVAVLLALVIFRGARAAVRRHGAHALAWRWFTGHHLDGQHRTNAGWFESGTQPLTQNGRASRWAHLARAHRAAWRTGLTLTAAAALAGLVVAPAITADALFGAGVAAVAFGAWRAYRGARRYRHTRRWVRPLHEALGRALGMPLAAAPRSWLTVPEDFARREGAQITVRLPDGFNNTGDESKRLVRDILVAKLALENPSASWHLAGRAPHVTFTVQVPPPDKVLPGTLANGGRLGHEIAVRELIDAAAPTAPLLGLGRGRKPVYADLDAESPHALVSAGSGGGKSVTTRTLVAQILAKGGVALILDVKRLSHAWARGLPNVRYCRDIAEIHEALLWLSAELDARNKLADEGADIDGNTDHVDVGPRIVVLAEEMNATAGRLATYWRQIKGKDDPAMSPAVDALADALFMGRQVKVNILAVAQMLTARTIGGGEARENMGIRILARYTLNNWRVLVPEIWPAPKASKHRGRVQVCVAGHANETQILFLTPAEARELATSGTVAQFPVAGQQHDAMRPTAIRLHVAGTAAPIGLRQACGEGVLPISLDAARKARTRDPDFPAHREIGDGGEQLYDRDELASWARNRPRAMAAGA
jgi:hypothetical protein